MIGCGAHGAAAAVREPDPDGPPGHALGAGLRSCSTIAGGSCRARSVLASVGWVSATSSASLLSRRTHWPASSASRRVIHSFASVLEGNVSDSRCTSFPLAVRRMVAV